jgi:ribosomal protein S18 acetylase RimI-like enzyme
LVGAGSRGSREVLPNLVDVVVRELRGDEEAWLRGTLRERWGEELIVGRGHVWRPEELSGLVAVNASGERAGLATYAVSGEVAELVTLDALQTGVGVGSRLLDAVAAAARGAGARRLIVMSTNDNLRALRLYQRAGFRLTELRPGAVDESRIVKPSIPVVGHDGIPIRDELDLMLDL